MTEVGFSVKRLDGLYRLFVEGLGEPLILSSDLLGHALGLIFGPDAAVPFKEVVDGEAGQLTGRPWVTAGQLEALRVLIGVYRQLRL